MIEVDIRLLLRVGRLRFDTPCTILRTYLARRPNRESRQRAPTKLADPPLHQSLLAEKKIGGLIYLAELGGLRNL